MENLSKLDKTVSELEEQAQVLKENSRVLGKLTQLSTSIEKSVVALKQGNENFEGTKKDIITSLNSFNNLLGQLDSKNERHIESLIAANKKAIRDIEETVSSKISRFSSDIQVTIRQERTQLQEAIQNNLATQFNGLEQKQKELFGAQAKQLNTLKILVGIVITVCAGIIIKLLL